MEFPEEDRRARLDQAVILALGGNLAGDYRSPAALLEAAVLALPQAGFTVVAQSSFWRSSAWPDPAQPPFVNLVVWAETTLTPEEALASALALEARFGRVRGVANAPRTLDIDLVAYGRRVIQAPDLILPHPRAHLRRFVMGPLAEIAPGWRHPTLGAAATELAATTTVGADAQPV